MAGSEYTHGEMDIAEQTRTWQGFITGTVWMSFIIVLLVTYSTLTVALGMNWLVALGLCAVTGIVGGLLLGLGSAWIATVVILSALAVIVQICIMLFGGAG